MNRAAKLEKLAKQAIRELRLQKLRKGQPFMINTEGQEPGTCWLEYPDGYIHLVKRSPARTGFETVRELSMEESNALRKQLGIS